MKKLLCVALVLFTVFMSYVFIGGFLEKQQGGGPTDNTSPGVVPAVNTGRYTLSEVAKHATSDDCWLIINSRVYDVSSFLGQHPGGAFTIIPYCGKEATRAFDTQDRGNRGGHSDQATQMLQEYLIGQIIAG